MTFAAMIRKLREEKSVSEVKLAELSGIPYGTIHTYVMGRRKPSFASVVKIARALGVTCEAFADCEDIAEEEKPSPKKARKAARTSSPPPAAPPAAAEPQAERPAPQKPSGPVQKVPPRKK